MERVKENAKESASKVTESFGIEGVKSERALHTRFMGAFKDITANGTNSAEAIGGAFENMAEGLKLSMGSMIALMAVSELVKSVYEGYEAFEKMEKAGKDALSIDTDVTHQSVEKVQESIKKLNEDAEAHNLAAMSSLQAGAEVVVQAFEEGKNLGEVVKEDAEEYNELKQKAHEMEDAEGAKQINNANAVLELKLQGHEKEAEALAHQQQMQEKLDAASEKHDEKTIDALNQEISLEDQIAAKEAARKAKETTDKVEGLQRDVYAEQMSRGTDADKLKLAKQQEEHAKFAYGDALTLGKDPVDIEQKRLEWEKAITREKELQKAQDDKVKATQKEITAEQERRKEIGETDKQRLDDAKAQSKKDADALAAAQGKGDKQTLLNLQLQAEKSLTAQKEAQLKVDQQAKEFAEQKTKILQEQKEAQQAVAAAQLDATMFHGEASSLAKLGLGGRVSGANYGNASQLKAAQDAAKHLAEINAAFKKLQSSIGIAG
jgi:colicin import membrane protein